MKVGGWDENQKTETRIFGHDVTDANEEEEEEEEKKKEEDGGRTFSSSHCI